MVVCQGIAAWAQRVGHPDLGPDVLFFDPGSRRRRYKRRSIKCMRPSSMPNLDPSGMPCSSCRANTVRCAPFRCGSLRSAPLRSVRDPLCSSAGDEREPGTEPAGACAYSLPRASARDLPLLPTAQQAAMDRNLMEITVPALGALYASHTYTVEQVTRWYLSDIASYNGVYRSVQTVDCRRGTTYGAPRRCGE